jgi:hypothetical protein
MYLERTNKLGYKEFCELFQFSTNYEWPRRVFDMINKRLTGFISLDEFFQFCVEYLIIDAGSTRRFCFRLLSRRAGTADSNTILDLQDMKTFIKFAYKIKRNHADKIANEIFQEMDNSGAFGLAPPEFDTYAIRNPVFLVFGNTFLTHFRLCIFGYDFWLKKSRKYKKSKAVGFGSFVRLKNANLESEELLQKIGKRAAANTAAATKKGKKESAKGKAGRKGSASTQDPDEGGGGAEGGGLPSIDENGAAKKRGSGSPPVVPRGSSKRRGSVFDRFLAPPSSTEGGKAGGGSRRRSILEVFAKKKKPEETPKVGVGPDGTVSEEFYDEDDVPEGEETDEMRRARLDAMVFHDDIIFDFVK